MNEPNERRYRRLLQDLITRLEPEIEAITEAVRQPSGGQSAGELSNAPMHLGDRGSDEYQQDLEATLLVNEQHLAEQVREALQRLDEGRFGHCLRCGNVIPTARLDAIPYARHCVRCAELEEIEPTANLNTGRPRTPADTLAPEDEMGERRHDRQRSHEKHESSAVGEEDGTEVSDADIHAVGTAGGGTAVGGLAGSTIGHGDPDVAAIEDTSGSSNFDTTEARQSASRRVSRF